MKKRAHLAISTRAIPTRSRLAISTPRLYWTWLIRSQIFLPPNSIELVHLLATSNSRPYQVNLIITHAARQWNSRKAGVACDRIHRHMREIEMLRAEISDTLIAQVSTYRICKMMTSTLCLILFESVLITTRQLLSRNILIGHEIQSTWQLYLIVKATQLWLLPPLSRSCLHARPS